MALFKKDEFEVVLTTNTHILVLDQKWHELFKGKKPLKILVIEKKLNQLLKEQGKLTNELKDYQGLKKKMMDEIVASMGQAYDDKNSEAIKTMEKNKKYIEQINKKLEHHESTLTQIPQKINNTNNELVSATMNHFYHTMIDRKKKSLEMEETVTKLKEQIKEAIIQRDEAKVYYQQLYGYVHDVVGAEIIEQYDRHYIGDKND